MSQIDAGSKHEIQHRNRLSGVFVLSVDLLLQLLNIDSTYEKKTWYFGETLAVIYCSRDRSTFITLWALKDLWNLAVLIALSVLSSCIRHKPREMSFHKAASYLVKLAHAPRLRHTKAETTADPLTGAIMRALISCETRHCNYGAYPRLISTSARHVVYTQRAETWIRGSHLRPSLSGGAVAAYCFGMAVKTLYPKSWQESLPRWENLEASQLQTLLRLTPALPPCLSLCARNQGVCAHKRCQVVAEPLE